MANYANLLATIAANIYTNGNNEVTAAMVKAAVDSMVASLGAGYQFMGVATPATNPGNTDVKQFYIASTPGTYTNFLDSGSNPLEVSDGEVAILYGSGSVWSKEVTGIASVDQINNIQALPIHVVTPVNEYKPIIDYKVKAGEEVYIKYYGGNASGSVVIVGGLTEQFNDNDGILKIVAVSDSNTIQFYGGSTARDFMVELYKGQGLETFIISQDYESDLKYHFGKLNRSVGTISLTPNSSNIKIDFYAKAGNRFRLYVTGLTGAAAMYAYKEDGTRYVIFAAIENGTYHDALLSENITGIAWHSNTSQTASYNIEVYDPDTKLATEVAGLLKSYVLTETKDFLVAVQQLKNGAVIRERGFDIPAGSTGNTTMIEFFVPLIDPDCDAYFDFITNLPASAFNNSWATSITQESDKIVRFKIGKSINEQYGSHRCIVYLSNSDSSIEHYLRLSRVTIEPKTSAAYNNCIARMGEWREKIVFEVCSDFSNSTTGFGTTRFNSILDANAAINYNDCVKRPIIRVMPGIYDEFATLFPVVNGEAQELRGIITWSGVTYESFDPHLPALTILSWDGHEGMGVNDNLTKTQAMDRCIFHINTRWDHLLLPTIINGFKIISANTRYCVHPESSGYGVGKSWELRNCILEWNGSDHTDDYVGRNLGIGLSVGETGLVENVQFNGSAIVGAGLGGHDNGFSANQGEAPEYWRGARLIVRGCNLGGGNIYMNTLTNDFENVHTIIVYGCDNVNRTYVDFEAGIIGVPQHWKGTVINSNVVQNDFNS